MGLAQSKPVKQNYNQIANDVSNITKDNFQEFTNFLGSYLEIYIQKFGEHVIINHLENLALLIRLKQIGIIKEKGEDE